jgi:hypothetical protein
MGTKKDIGKLLNEQLSGFSKAPHDKVWANIEAELKKSKRRIFPFWLIFLGAGLLILSTASIIVYNNYVSTQQEQLDTDSINNTTIDQKMANPTLETKTNKLVTPQNDSIVNRSIVSTNDANQTLKISKKQNSGSTSTSTANKLSNSKGNPNNNFKNNNNSKKALKDSKNTFSEYSQKLNNILFLQGYPIVFLKTAIDTNIQLQSEPIIPIEKNKHKKTKPKEDHNTFLLKAYIGPNYFNSLEKGSSIDEDLISNRKTAAINISYGAAIVYEFSPRSRISFGIARSNLSYTTKNADATNSNGQLIKSYGFYRLSINSSPEEISASLGALSTIDLKQNIGLWEVPIEYSYKIIGRKLNLKTYGGVSFISLSENSITAVSSNGNSLNIGKATNLSKLSASLNFGTGLGYKLSDKLELFMEPTFKYHINLFDHSDNFKPYGLSARVGLLYRF